VARKVVVNVVNELWRGTAAAAAAAAAETTTTIILPLKVF
jgi:hypothetical protein